MVGGRCRVSHALTTSGCRALEKWSLLQVGVWENLCTESGFIGHVLICDAKHIVHCGIAGFITNQNLPFKIAGCGPILLDWLWWPCAAFAG
jgi:hypothetical protein